MLEACPGSLEMSAGEFTSQVLMYLQSPLARFECAACGFRSIRLDYGGNENIIMTPGMSGGIQPHNLLERNRMALTLRSRTR